MLNKGNTPYIKFKVISEMKIVTILVIYFKSTLMLQHSCPNKIFRIMFTSKTFMITGMYLYHDMCYIVMDNKMIIDELKFIITIKLLCAIYTSNMLVLLHSIRSW